MTYITDSQLYEIEHANDTTITRFSDDNKVKIKLHMNCTINTNFTLDKCIKRNIQHQNQKYFVCLINCVITLISLKSGNLSQISSFGNIAWMISSLSDNIKSLQYKDYILDFINLCTLFEKHKYVSKKEIYINKVKSVKFIDASFGYLDSLCYDYSLNNIIKNLTFEFTSNNLYYLEDSNGKGKSTIMKMFLLNLSSGNIFFDNINRINISFENIYKLVFHVYQASEYMPVFSKKEIESYKNIILQGEVAFTNIIYKNGYLLDQISFDKKIVFYDYDHRRNIDLKLQLFNKNYHYIVIYKDLTIFDDGYDTNIIDGYHWMCGKKYRIEDNYIGSMSGTRFLSQIQGSPLYEFHSREILNN
jgi:hypothetical protein